MDPTISHDEYLAITLKAGWKIFGDVYKAITKNKTSPARQWTTHERAQYIALSDAGFSQTEIARRLKRSCRSVINFRYRDGIPAKQRKARYSAELKKTIQKLRYDGLTYEQIADKIGRTEQAIGRHVRNERKKHESANNSSTSSGSSISQQNVPKATDKARETQSHTRV